MKIYFTNKNGERRICECDLSEVVIPNKIATDGVKEYPIYTIFNSDNNEISVIMFGDKTEIGGSLRDAFWKCVKITMRRKIPIFDVDEWYDTIRFVDAKGKRIKKKQE